MAKPNSYYLATGNADLERLIDQWEEAFKKEELSTLYSLFFQLIGYAAAAAKR